MSKYLRTENPIFIFLLICYGISGEETEVKGANEGCKRESSIMVSSRPTSFRLPTTLFPKNYKLKLFVVLDPLPDFTRFTATGQVDIEVVCEEATSLIYLHAVDLAIAKRDVHVYTDSGRELHVTGLSFDLANEFLIISLKCSLEAGDRIRIRIKFIAPIPADDFFGMYQDHYENTLGETRVLATTEFEANYARKLYPCFDEPSFRAEYDVEITHHRKYLATLSNEQLLLTKPVKGFPDYVTDVFRTTPSIPSYTVAMLVSDFTFVEIPPNHFKRTVRVYARPQLTSMGAGDYTANVTDGVMGFFEDRFRIPYPLSKLDSVALPNFPFGGMENVGLIVYHERYALYLKDETSELDRFNINFVVSHELAHQWFGNIVTIKWWTWLWLSEGFAELYAFHGTEATNPELDAWQYFPKTMNDAMYVDGIDGTPPLENAPLNSAALEGIFTDIPYYKGASVLRMTSTFLTESVFEGAIRKYLDKFQYKSVEQNELFEELQMELDRSPEVAKFIPESVKEIMNSWAQQSKFPVIKVTVDNTASQIIFEQEEFSEVGTPGSTTWWVPIFLQPRRSGLPGTVADVWIPQNQKSITIEMVGSEDEVVVVNPDGIGYYRVLYDDDHIRKILQLWEDDHERIPAGGRSKLMDDYFQLALSGYTSIESAMEHTKFMGNETSSGVWTTFSDWMETLWRLLNNIGDYETRDLLSAHWAGKAELAMEKSTSLILNEMLIRIRFSCEFGPCLPLEDDEVADVVKTLEGGGLSKEYQFPSYCAAVSRDKGKLVFELILDEYRNPQTLFGRRVRLLEALSCTTNSDNLKWLVNQVISHNETMLPHLDKLQILKDLAKKSESAEEILSRLQQADGLDEFYQKFKFGKSIEKIIANVIINGNLGVTSAKAVVERLTDLGRVKGERIGGLIQSSWKRQEKMKKIHLDLRMWLQTNLIKFI